MPPLIAPPINPFAKFPPFLILIKPFTVPPIAAPEATPIKTVPATPAV